MAREISEVSLEFDPLEDGYFDESDIEILEPEELDGVRDDAPHLVFLIPGIRTNGWWAQEARMQELLWDGREVHFVPVRGNGGSTDRLSSWHLLSRLGLSSFRQNFSSQISILSSQRNYASVNVFAHSMGSALFSDIVESLAAEIPKGKFDTVAFIGSVCHRSHAQRLHGCTSLFVNDVGTEDYWPFVASTVRPYSYSDVGFSGFLNGFAYDRFFTHNHTSCTSIEHLKDELVPLISASDVRPLGVPTSKRPHYNTYIYLRRAMWGLTALLAAWLLSSAIT